MLSAAMREVTPLIQLLKYLKVVWNVITAPPTVTYKAFENNQCCIVVTESKKQPTRTKNIVIKCHHFCNLADDGVIKIIYINTKKKLSEILTK